MTNQSDDQTLEQLESIVNASFSDRLAFTDTHSEPFGPEDREELDRLNRLTLQALAAYYEARDAK